MRELASYHQLCSSGLELSPVPGASSDTSSPRSSTTEDELHDGNFADQGACNTAKPIYNFSIPDFIKHERPPPPSAANSLPPSEASALPEMADGAREAKRRHDQRDSVEAVEGGEASCAINRTSCRKNKRRRTDQPGNPSNPDFIDLTDVTDQDEAASDRVLDEINHSPYLDSSIVLDPSRDPSDRRQHAANPYDSVAENLQRFRRTLRETLIRREATNRESRIFNRLSHLSNPCSEAPRVVSDGPVYTSQRDLGPHQGAGNLPNFDFRNAEPPVITLDEEIEAPTRNRDQEVTRMLLEDSLYSLPFVTPYQNRRAPPLETIAEDIDRREERRRENENHVHRLRQQTQERINHVRSRISRLDQHVNSNNNNNNRNGYFIRISDSPQESRIGEDEVEFLRELRPGHNTSTMSARSNETNATGHPNFSWSHLSRRRRFSNLFSTANLGVPDFLFPYVHFINPSATPRLHHFPSTFYDEGEDYEALWTLAERIGPAKPRGLSRAEIDRIHAFRYSASKADETNSTCVVCMSEYNFKEKIRKLPCTHDFHSKCIDKWLKSNKTCPVCRDEVKCM